MQTVTAKSGGGQTVAGAGPTVVRPTTVVTQASPNDSLTMQPAATSLANSQQHDVQNGTGVAILLYPAPGDTIDSLGVNQPYRVPANSKVRLSPSQVTKNNFTISFVN